MLCCSPYLCCIGSFLGIELFVVYWLWPLVAIFFVKAMYAKAFLLDYVQVVITLRDSLQQNRTLSVQK